MKCCDACPGDESCEHAKICMCGDYMKDHSSPISDGHTPVSMHDYYAIEAEKMKRIYIAAPFFTPQQLATVKNVERIIEAVGLEYYSPRSEGVLQDMSPEVRKANLQRIFETNVNQLNECNALLAILDERDTGTHFEMGVAYATGTPILGYTSNPDVKLNVMLRQSLYSHACGTDECVQMLNAFAQGYAWAPYQVGETY